MKQFKRAGVWVVSMLMTITFLTTTASAADYRVQQNDTLYRIGTLFNTSVSTIKSDNDLNSNIIHPGQVLNVPAITYTVKSGDTLFLIAKNYNITMESLRKANNKWDNYLIPGQKLLLPGVKPNGSGSTVSSSQTVIHYTQAEVDLLARLITAEATGQPYDAMVGVGAVVVNRVQSNEWPSTISSVINQVIGGYYQFTPVKNGYINHPASELAKNAAWEALKGSDPSNGAIFYFDDSSTNTWLWSKPITARFGKMVFAK